MRNALDTAHLSCGCGIHCRDNTVCHIIIFIIVTLLFMSLLFSIWQFYIIFLCFFFQIKLMKRNMQCIIKTHNTLKYNQIHFLTYHCIRWWWNVSFCKPCFEQKQTRRSISHWKQGKGSENTAGMTGVCPTPELTYRGYKRCVKGVIWKPEENTSLSYTRITDK